MLKTIKSSLLSKILPYRRPDSHKGENGRVLIVGGSIDYYGAPILAGLGAFGAGADLLYQYVPECNFAVTRNSSPDFIVKNYKGNFLNKEAVKEIVEFGKNHCDAVLVGPGLGDKEESLEAVKEILSELHLPTVIDADAIQVLKKIDKFPLEQTIVVTPHMHEFQEMVDKDVVIREEDTQSIILLRSISMDLHINILLKGATDFVSSEEGEVQTNQTGNSAMTVGGTGDVLSGVVAALLAQRATGFDAARMAAFYNGKAGDILLKQRGYGFKASDLAEMISYAMK